MGHRKLYRWPQNAALLSDKFAVRDFVKSRVGEEILNEIFYIGADPDNIDWAALPRRFFAKGTHGSGKDYNICVPDKNEITADVFRRQCRKILGRTFGRLSNERWYEKIKPQIIIEKFLGDSQYLVAPDYKFLTFNGHVAYIGVITGRFSGTRATFYDAGWKRATFTMKFEPGPDIPRPENLAEMIAVAEKLAAGLDFARIDLYNIDGRKIVFGEITLCYGAGWDAFKPGRFYDEMLGAYWPSAENQDEKPNKRRHFRED
jgi:hypothetical protein